ncbi:MAG: hypothetical protein HFH68_01345 [Lachnospiraceae bacterium]|nr:hypothetical protein [Lachnospiraceae bacterium]
MAEEIIAHKAEAARADGEDIGIVLGKITVIKNLLLNGLLVEEIEKLADVTKTEINKVKVSLGMCLLLPMNFEIACINPSELKLVVEYISLLFAG